MVEGKSVNCVDWWEVGFSTALGGAGGWAFGPASTMAGGTQVLTSSANMTSKRVLEMLFGRMLKEGEGKAVMVLQSIADKLGKAEVKQLAADMGVLLSDPAFRQKWAKELARLTRLHEIIQKIGNSGVFIEMRPTKLLPGLQ